MIDWDELSVLNWGSFLVFTCLWPLLAICLLYYIKQETIFHSFFALRVLCCLTALTYIPLIFFVYNIDNNRQQCDIGVVGEFVLYGTAFN